MLGILYYANGDTYDGEWKDDRINGLGIARLIKCRDSLLYQWR